MSSKGNVGSAVSSLIMVIVRFEILCLTIGLWLGLLSSLADFSNLCFKRYNFDTLNSTNYAVAANVTVRGDGNYTTLSKTVNGKQVLYQDPSKYGKWVKANYIVQPKKQLKITVSGNLSLCRAYVPLYNLQDRTIPAAPVGSSIYHLNAAGAKVPIPRVEENVPPLTLIFDARANGWRNLTEVYRNDLVKVILNDNVNPNTPPVTYPVTLTAQDCANAAPAAKDICNKALAIDEKKNFAAADCDNVPADAKSACLAQAAVAPGATVNTITIADCNAMDPSARKACIATIPVAPVAVVQAVTPVSPVPTTNVYNYIVTDSITGVATQSDCSEGKRVYSGICGRYSLWNGTQSYAYSAQCAEWSRCAYNCDCDCPWYDSLCLGSDYCDRCSCLQALWTPLPAPYLDSGAGTNPRFTSESFRLQDYTRDPTIDTSRENCFALAGIRPETKFWFSATDAAGLQTRFDTNVYPTNPTVLGSSSTYSWARILVTDPYEDQYTPRKIYSGQYGTSDVAYMQYRFHGANWSTTQTGGYVIRLLQTKCRRANGNIIKDSVEGRGALQYVVAPSGKNPNDPRNSILTASPTTLTFDGNSQTMINTDDNAGYFWFRIKNTDQDYPDSIGSYVVSIAGQQNAGSFTVDVMSPLLNAIRNRIYSVSLGMFSNMICYQQEISGACINFFNYIRALLMLYVITIGYRFLLGANIKQAELAKSVAKVAIVAGLINGSTFEYFHEQIYPFVVGFSDQMISNMSGFSMISSSNTISNPFMFLDALMSKMFLNPTFLFQLLTVMGMGLTGILYFLIICIATIIFIIAIFRAMSIYIMAMIATAFLIGIAPVFLVFILFEQTYYLFENWAKFLFKFMMEPVIVMAGIIILTQLFSLYVDQVLSYSLCWKCTIAFHIPFATLLPFPGLQDIPLFCIYWFGPWGLSPSNDTIGMDVAMMVGMAIVAFTAYGYVELAAKMAVRLSASTGGPSSIGMGSSMNHDLGQRVLKNYGLDDKGMKAAKERMQSGNKPTAAQEADEKKGSQGGKAEGEEKLAPTTGRK